MYWSITLIAVGLIALVIGAAKMDGVE